MILKGYFSLPKKTAAPIPVSTVASCSPSANPELLTISVDKFVRNPQFAAQAFDSYNKNQKMKNEAGLSKRNALYFEYASSHFLWTKLCASALSDFHPIDLKEQSYTA